MKNSKAITLISLVLTIIVILILTAITVNMVTGENGIIKNTNNAKEQTEIANEKEIIQKATVSAMNKDKYGDLTQDELQNQLDKEQEGKTEVSKIRKDIVVRFKDTDRMYKVEENGNVSEYQYIELPFMESGRIFTERIKEYRDKIENVKVLDDIDIPINAKETWDVSKEQNDSIKAWLVSINEDDEYYNLYIGGKGGIELENSSAMFSYLSNCKSIDLDNVYTENATNMSYMFSWCVNLEEIKNLENFDTRNVCDMTSMFGKCLKLKELNVSNFDTRKVTSMQGMFGQLAVSKLDLSNFDTSNVLTMTEMFRGCYFIEELDLSSFNTSKLQRAVRMFYDLYNLKKIYVSEKWNNESLNLSDGMFGRCQNLEGKIKYDNTKVDGLYANYTTGYFTKK